MNEQWVPHQPKWNDFTLSIMWLTLMHLVARKARIKIH